MNRTRWKLLIGTLGLSLGGLAAVADVPSQNGIVSCTPGKPHQVARVVYQEPPIPIPVPKVADVPMAGAPMIPAPAIIPVIGDIVPPPVAVPTLSPAPVVFVPAPPLPTITLSEPVIPQSVGQAFELVIPSGVANRTVLQPSKPLDPLMKVKVAGAPTKLEDHITGLPPGTVSLQPVRDLALPSVPEPVAVKPTPAPPIIPAPIFIERIPTPPAPVPVQAAVVAQEIPRIPATEPPLAKPIPPAPRLSWDPRADAIPTEAPSEPARNLEKKLKVLLHMGDERPRFEVKDGDDIYLKVISDKVEVKSPSDSGANMSTMRAGGKVTFITPGGEGTCDELSVIPGTGQVIVTGKVAFTYNWGKVETTVSGEKMTFRLGSTPGTTPSSGTQGVPTSYQRMR